MYAIIQTGGKQYRVEKDSFITVDKMNLDEGAAFETDQVLFLKDGKDVFKVGTPVVTGATVKGTILSHGKTKKIVVFKMKRRKGYRKKQGHRQDFTRIKITDIVG